MAVEVIVEVAIDDDGWLQLDMEALAVRACRAALSEAGLDGRFEVSLLATDDQAVADLNHRFRDKASPTNVLSWPTEDLSAANAGDWPAQPTCPEIGDIALAYQTCHREAVDSSLDFHDHVTHLVLHACLHLLGFDHETDEDATVMERLEVSALAKLGIDDPYS